MSRTVKFGLIGYGAWGRHHADAISKAQGAALVAIAARSAASAEQAQADYPEATVYSNYRELLKQDDLDAVSIVVPSHLHHEIAAAALESGLHVLLEKPMSLSVEDCDSLIAISNKQQRHLIIGHELRLSSLWGQVRDLIDSGVIGDPQYVLVELSRNPYRQGAQGWRYDLQQVGSWILEEPIHFFDLARWYLESTGRPVSIYATANSRQEHHPELQDNFSAIFHTENGAYAVVSQTLSAFEHHQTVKVTGTRGAIWASWSGAMDRTRHPTFFLRVFDGTQVVDKAVEKSAGELFELDDELAGFTQLILGESPRLCTAEDGRWSVALCLAAQRSVQSRKVEQI